MSLCCCDSLQKLTLFLSQKIGSRSSYNGAVGNELVPWHFSLISLYLYVMQPQAGAVLVHMPCEPLRCTVCLESHNDTHSSKRTDTSCSSPRSNCTLHSSPTPSCVTLLRSTAPSSQPLHKYLNIMVGSIWLHFYQSLSSRSSEP
ncbi:hypothetical protein AMTRI_Chr08g168230 [Amborella trichopoda]